MNREREHIFVYIGVRAGAGDDPADIILYYIISYYIISYYIILYHIISYYIGRRRGARATARRGGRLAHDTTLVIFVVVYISHVY